MLKPIIHPRFKKGEIVRIDADLICNDCIYLQTTKIIDDILAMDKKDPKGIDSELLKSWELDTTKMYRVVGTFLNPERIQTNEYDHMDYYLYLIEDIETGFVVHLVEECDLELVEDRGGM